MSNEQKLLRDILDSNLEELLHHDLYTVKLERPLECYMKVLLNYLKADIHELEVWTGRLKELMVKNNDPEISGMYICASIRLMIRKNKISEEELLPMEQLVFPEPWAFELNLVLGLAYIRINLFEKSAHFFDLSYRQFSQFGCRKKALIAYQNHVVSRLNLNPNQSYLAEWSFLVKLARKEKITSMEGGALINLSREYQNIGSFIPALKAVSEALESLGESSGTYQYYLALLQKCDLLHELGRNQEALEVYQEAKLCPFLELKPALNILEGKIVSNKDPSSIERPESPPWQERLDDLKNGKKVKQTGNLVQLLLAELEEGPKDKHELIEVLYPENIDYEIKENRFKVLLSKVRKTHPGLIRKNDNVYQLEMSHEWLKKKIS